MRMGVTRAAIRVRLEQGRLHEVHFGVYAVGYPSLTREGRWMAAVLAAGPASLLSHRDGLALYEVADFRLPEVEVTLPDLGSRRRRGIRIHRTRYLDPADRQNVNGIPVTSLARTLADVAGSISPRHLRDAYLEGGRRNLLDLGALQRVVEQGRGKRGIHHLRRLVAADNVQLLRTKSPLEVRFFDFCRKHGFPEPISNAVIHGCEVDAHWPGTRLVVELDSWEFHRGRGAFERDRAKIGDLMLHGFDALPITHEGLTKDEQKIVAIIRKALEDAT